MSVSAILALYLLGIGSVAKFSVLPIPTFISASFNFKPVMKLFQFNTDASVRPKSQTTREEIGYFYLIIALILINSYYKALSGFLICCFCTL